MTKLVIIKRTGCGKTRGVARKTKGKQGAFTAYMDCMIRRGIHYKLIYYARPNRCHVY